MSIFKGTFKDKNGNILHPQTQAAQVLINDVEGESSNVNAEIAALRTRLNTIEGFDALRFKGVVDGSNALPTEDVSVGDTYKVGAAGTYAEIVCEVGDVVICTSADPVAWQVVQANIDGAVTGPASSTASNLAAFDGATGKVIKDSAIAMADVSDAVSKKHAHDNASTLDAITAEVKAGYDAAKTFVDGLAAEDISASEINGLVDRMESAEGDIDALQASVGTDDEAGDLFTRMGVVESDLSNQTEGPDTAVDGNMVAFDGTSGKKVKDSAIAMSDVADAVSKKHAHTNTVAEIDAATDFIQSLDASVTAAALKSAVDDDHTHSNKSVLDAINSVIKDGYDTASAYVYGLTVDATTVNGLDPRVTALEGNRIIGPDSAVGDNLIAFDLTTGKLAKDSGLSTTAVSAAATYVAALDGTHATTAKVNGFDERIATLEGAYVAGPASSVDTDIAVYDGTTGKTIKDGGITLLRVKTSVEYTEALTVTAAQVNAAVANRDLCVIANGGEVPTGLASDGIYFEKDA